MILMNNNWSDISAKRSPLKKMSAPRRNVSKKRTNKDVAEELPDAPIAKRTNKSRLLPALEWEKKCIEGIESQVEGT
jgi:hypothetical protein